MSYRETRLLSNFPPRGKISFGYAIGELIAFDKKVDKYTSDTRNASFEVINVCLFLALRIGIVGVPHICIIKCIGEEQRHAIDPCINVNFNLSGDSLLDKLESFEHNNMASPSPQSSPMPPPQAPSPMGPPQQAPSPSNAQGSPMGPPQHHPHSPTQGYQGGPPMQQGGPPMSQPPQQPPPQQQNYPPHPQQMPPNMGPQV